MSTVICTHVDMTTLAKEPNYVTACINIMGDMREAGIPVNGLLVYQGISRGVMRVNVDQGLDGDIQHMYWAETEAELDKLPTLPLVRTHQGKHSKYWVYSDEAQKAKVDDDDL